MAFQAALSQVSAFFSPTPGTVQPSRVQPPRRARKQLDHDFVYPSQTTRSSIECGTTLTESQLISNNSPIVRVLDTQPILDGNDSLIVTVDSEASDVSTIPDSQVITTTPQSNHGRLMFTALSRSMSDDSLSQSLLPMSDFNMYSRVADDSVPISSTPANCDINMSQVIPTEALTKTVKVCRQDQNTQTTWLTDKHRDVALFRSDGNLSVLSNFYQIRLKHNGVTYASAEQAYQHRMAMYHARPDTAHRVLTARTPAQAKKAGKAIKKSEQWHESKSKVMSEILLDKSKQCTIFRETLVKTGRKHLLHNIDTDSFWGCGPDLMGLNMMGTLLAELRAELISKQQLPKPVSPERVNGPSIVTRAHNTTISAAQPKTEKKMSPESYPQVTSRRPGARRLPASKTSTCPETPDNVLILGNSNARQMAHILGNLNINAKSFCYPGGTLDYLSSRIHHIARGPDPSHIILMAGDIEAANGLPSLHITQKYENLVRTIRRVYPWSRLILVGLTMTSASHRRAAIQCTNALMQHLASQERMIAFVDNNNSKLRDNIHLTLQSKEALCQRITKLVNRPHLEYIKKF